MCALTICSARMAKYPSIGSWGVIPIHEATWRYPIGGRLVAGCPEGRRNAPWSAPRAKPWRTSNPREGWPLGRGWVQRGQARPLSMGEGIRSYACRGAPKAPRWREMALILSDPLSGRMSDREAPYSRRGCNGERAAGSPCQDERLAKPEPQAQDFVIQTHILRNVLTHKTGSKPALVGISLATRLYTETRHIETYRHRIAISVTP